MKKPIYKTNKETIIRFDSTKAAIEDSGLNVATFYKKLNKKVNGWYYCKNLEDLKVRDKDLTDRRVIQYNMRKHQINEFENIISASHVDDCDKILKCCREHQKSLNGNFWSFEEEDID